MFIVQMSSVQFCVDLQFLFLVQVHRRQQYTPSSTWLVFEPMTSRSWTHFMSMRLPLVLEHTLLQSHLVWENSAFVILLHAAIANHYRLAFFVPPGTHHCWVDRGSMEWDVCPTLLHMTNLKLNPRNVDFEFNALPITCSQCTPVLYSASSLVYQVFPYSII